MKSVLRWIALGLGGLSAALGLALAMATYSALAVVVPVWPTSLVLATAALILAGLSGARCRRAHPRRFGGAMAVMLVAGLAVAVAAGLGPLRVRSESITMQGNEVELSGTLFLPRNRPVQAAVVLVHGSGAQTRDELRLYAQWFASHGVAALAYDKRGVGASTGDLYRGDYRDYAEDAALAVRTLRDRFDLPVGLMGFSEAEWVLPLAAKATQPAFLIVVGPSATTPAEQVSEEIELRLRRAGYGDADIEQALELNARVLQVQRGHPDPGLNAALSRASARPWFSAAQDLPPEVDPADVHPWWRRVMDFDPAAAWNGVEAPALFLKGQADDRSDADRASARLQEITRGIPDVVVKILPAADHMLLHWPLGAGRPPPVFAAGFLEHLQSFVTRHTGRDSASQ